MDLGTAHLASLTALDGAVDRPPPGRRTARHRFRDTLVAGMTGVLLCVDMVGELSGARDQRYGLHPVHDELLASVERSPDCGTMAFDLDGITELRVWERAFRTEHEAAARRLDCADD